MGVAMRRVYLLRLQMSRQLSPPWPVYVAGATGCHQEDWDPEVSGVRCSVCDRRLDSPPPAAGPSCSQEPVPLIELPDDDDEVEEINFYLVAVADDLQNLMNNIKKMTISEEQEAEFQKIERYHICNKCFD
ncbi:unnamed protein product [Trichogramma brassicae]|uniref:Uncharacterized protein n=1 Tax=Trichogramma brassicae TaxID=86971 RepID=A0A6H5J1N1_9HYME|nr:unnamed protein product [Trichogramma brassicae]